MLAEAEPLFRRALMGRQMKLGPKHPDTLEVMNNLAKLLQADRFGLPVAVDQR